MVECPFPKPGNLIETNNLRVVPLVLDELSRTFEMIVLYEMETYRTTQLPNKAILKSLKNDISFLI